MDFHGAHNMKKAPNMPYSSDLAPLDFYLFDYVKYCLVDTSFADADELLQAIGTVLIGIQTITLNAIFLE
jgi:hypothetical protein